MGSKESMMQPEGQPRTWLRDNFILSNDKASIDPSVVNDAFGSDLMWWNDPMQLGQMQKMLDSCMTFGIYWVPETEKEMKENGIPRRTNGADFKMVGFGRVVTDYVTFAYLTDVFVLEDYQRRGLAHWMMRSIKEIVSEWPNLRGLILMTHDKAAARMYERELGAVDFNKGPSAGLVLLEMPGVRKKSVPNGH